MPEMDTVGLLRECDAGIQMGIASLDDVLDNVTDAALRSRLTECRNHHDRLLEEVQHLLDRYHSAGKEPNPMAKGMSWVKTNMKLGMEDSDRTIADVITDGCNMGVKSLNRYLNQYRAADERAKELTRRLIRLEERLADDLQRYL